MSNLSRSAALFSALVLVGASAGAETYQILDGVITTDPPDSPDPSGERSESEALTGAFEISVRASDSFATAERTSLSVDDFAMQAGDHSLTPNPRPEFGGLSPSVFLEVADQIQLQEDKVGLAWLRSGGELVGVGDDEVTFRFLDFRSDLAVAGRAIGRLADGVLPRRLELAGTLHEVDQVFRIQRDPCVLTPVPAPFPPFPPSQTEGEILHSWLSLDISVAERIEIEQLPPSGRVTSRVGGGEVTSIEGELREGGEVYILNAPALDFAFVSASSTPSLVSLGITAPDGANVHYDGVTGELTVTSDGDLFLDGGVIDLPGLTSVTISTLGTLTVSGALSLPSDVTLQLEADRDVVVEREVEVLTEPVASDVEISYEPRCGLGLWPIFPAQERVVGSFSLVASAARQIDVDVQPRRRHNRVPPGQSRWISVAILGSDDLDVRDVDPTSLKLGPDEAEPMSWHSRRPTRRGYANRDRHLDLLASFDVRETGVAYGDTELCLVAETLDGEPLEGCDTIQSLPDWLHSVLHQARSRRAR